MLVRLCSAVSLLDAIVGYFPLSLLAVSSVNPAKSSLFNRFKISASEVSASIVPSSALEASLPSTLKGPGL